MASLREKVEAELEQMDQALRLLPEARRVPKLSVLELGGTASLLSSVYHGVENILKQGLLSVGVQARGESVCEYAGDERRRIQISGRAVAGEDPRAKGATAKFDV